MYSPYGCYGTLPRYPGLQLPVKQPDAVLDYTVSVAEAITDPVTGIVDPLVSLSLLIAPSGSGEIDFTRLSLDDTGLDVTLWEVAGVPGRNYTLNLEGTTVAGRTYQWLFGQVCSPELAAYELPPAPNPGFGTPITWAANGTLTAFGGFVALSTLGQWPTSSDGLPPGGFYAASNPAATYIYAVPGFGDLPGSDVYLGKISGAALLALGAAPFPKSDPHIVNKCYMNGDILCVSLG